LAQESEEGEDWIGVYNNKVRAKFLGSLKSREYKVGVSVVRAGMVNLLKLILNHRCLSLRVLSFLGGDLGSLLILDRGGEDARVELMQVKTIDMQILFYCHLGNLHQFPLLKSTKEGEREMQEGSVFFWLLREAI